jgi:hypothetical protein
MIRVFYLIALTFLIFLITACPAQEVTTPCQGDSCPRLCDNLAIADRPSAQREPNEDVAKLNAETSFKNCYKPGETATTFFNISPTDKANLNASEFIITFAIVEQVAPGDFRDVTSRVLNLRSISSNPDIFSDPLPMDELRSGISGDVSFAINNSAPKGNYSLVLYFYRGTNGFDASARIGRVVYLFRVDR